MFSAYLCVCPCVCVCVLSHLSMCVVADALWNVCVCVCVCMYVRFFVCAHALTFVVPGVTRYLKCRHGAVISEQGWKVGHNSAGPGQDLSQEPEEAEGAGGGEEEKGEGSVLQSKD